MAIISLRKNKSVSNNSILYGASSISHTNNIDNNYVTDISVNNLNPSIQFSAVSEFNTVLNEIGNVNNKLITGYDKTSQYAVSIANGQLASSKIVDMNHITKQINGTVEGFISIHKIDPDSKTVKVEEIQYTQNKQLADTIGNITKGYIPTGTQTGTDNKFVTVQVTTVGGTVTEVNVSTNNIVPYDSYSALSTYVSNINNRLSALENINSNADLTTYETIVFGENIRDTKPFDISNNFKLNIIQGATGEIIDTYITINYAKLTESNNILYGIATDGFVTDYYNYKWNSSIIPVVNKINSSVNNIESNIVKLNSSVNNIETSIGIINGSINIINTSINTLDTFTNNINSSVIRLNTSVNTLESNIFNINSSLNRINTSVNTLESTISNINSSVSRLNTSVNTLESNISNINSSISNLNTSVNTLESNISNINSSISTLKTSDNTINSSISELRTLISTNTTNITNINSSISDIITVNTTQTSDITDISTRLKTLESTGLPSNGADGASAGFADPSAYIGTNDPTQSPSVTVNATGPNTAKEFKFCFNNIRGKDGTNGTNGSDGNKIYCGTAISQNTTGTFSNNISGNSGDIYINTSNFNLYQCLGLSSGSYQWKLLGNIKGADGTNGTGSSYSEATSSTLGLVKTGYNSGNNNVTSDKISCPVKLLNGQMYIEISKSELETLIPQNTTSIPYTPVFLTVE